MSRNLLMQAGYEVHEASYGSVVGDNTDIFDWPRKFCDDMDKVITCDRQDIFYSDGKTNDVVLFKSCLPNSLFVGQGTEPGNPTGPELTVENAKAAYRTLLPEFAKHPSKLFVAITTPPHRFESTPLYKSSGGGFLASQAWRVRVLWRGSSTTGSRTPTRAGWLSTERITSSSLTYTTS